MKECWEEGVRLHRTTVKQDKHINSIFFFIQPALRAPYHVAALQRQKPGQGWDTAVLLINWIWGCAEVDRPLWCYHIPVFMDPLICVIRINLTGEVCCRTYWGLWLWFEPNSAHSGSSLTAYLHLQHIGLLCEWRSLCYESAASEKAAPSAKNDNDP